MRLGELRIAAHLGRESFLEFAERLKTNLARSVHKLHKKTLRNLARSRRQAFYSLALLTIKVKMG
jgi:hypothetical protein